MTTPSVSPGPAPDGNRVALDEAGERLRRRPAPGFRPLHDRLRVSFELFPPKNDEGEGALIDCVTALAPLQPEFFSVTYGAGGSTRDRTVRLAARVAREWRVPVAGHLTCVGAARRDVDAVVQTYADAGIRHVVALRGDAAEGASRFQPHPDGYQSSVELVASIARRGDFDISVGCYPEVHPDAASADADLDYLKRKVDAGASRAITQFFFDPEVFLRFVDRARAAGISVPIVPGILPVHSFSGVQRFAERCGATVPRWLVDLFAPLEQAPELRPLVAATVCAELCTRLRDRGVQQFHFYTLNRAQLTAAACHVLGARPAQPADAARAAGQ